MHERGFPARPGPVALALEQVSMFEVCRQIGIDVPDDVLLGRASVKLFCPQGDLYHSDGGVDPVFRIYSDTNTGWCFKCNKLFTPVSLYAITKGISQTEAAKELLEIIGFKYDSSQVKIANLLLTPDKPIDYAALAETLKAYCGRICPDWELRQFDVEISQALVRCLAILSKVKSSDDVNQWLVSTKQFMQSVLSTKGDLKE